MNETKNRGNFLRQCERLGWSNASGGASSIHRAVTSDDPPRAMCRWNPTEDGHLRDHVSLGYSISRLAKAHGRSTGAIVSRLGYLGIADRDAIAALDFENSPVVPPVHTNCRSAQENKMKMTANRLMLLLSIYRGTLSSDRHPNTMQSDLTYLVNQGLVALSRATVSSGRIDVGTISTTPAGDAFIGTMLSCMPGMPSGGVENYGGAPITASRSKETGMDMLSSQRFFMVAAGEVDNSAPTPYGRLRLKRPPTVAHGDVRTAESEALRLAEENKGQRFFVLQAVSVHEVTPPPVVSKQL